jgi:hypothetical protein
VTFGLTAVPFKEGDRFATPALRFARAAKRTAAGGVEQNAATFSSKSWQTRFLPGILI